MDKSGPTRLQQAAQQQQQQVALDAALVHLRQVAKATAVLHLAIRGEPTCHPHSHLAFHSVSAQVQCKPAQHSLVNPELTSSRTTWVVPLSEGSPSSRRSRTPAGQGQTAWHAITLLAGAAVHWLHHICYRTRTATTAPQQQQGTRCSRWGAHPWCRTAGACGRTAWSPGGPSSPRWPPPAGQNDRTVSVVLIHWSPAAFAFFASGPSAAAAWPSATCLSYLICRTQLKRFSAQSHHLRTHLLATLRRHTSGQAHCTDAPWLGETNRTKLPLLAKGSPVLRAQPPHEWPAPQR